MGTASTLKMRLEDDFEDEPHTTTTINHHYTTQLTKLFLFIFSY